MSEHMYNNCASAGVQWYVSKPTNLLIFPSKGIENLELGDLIEIFRDLYQHWAVYVGNGYVVHLVSLGE